MPRLRFLLPACLALAACTGPATPPAAPSASQPQAAEAEAKVDGATVHVTAVQTSQLPEQVAREYGIERSPRTILLLVNLRDLGDGPAPSVSASVTDLQARSTAVPLREVRILPADAGTTDYIGTVNATLPDTLRFTVRAVRDRATATLQLSRDFYPQ